MAVLVFPWVLLKSASAPLAVFNPLVLCRSASAPVADHELAVRRLHSLQGSAGLVGARQIEHLAAWLTQAVKDRKRKEVDETVPLLRDALRRFQQELEGRMEAINGR